MAISIKPNHLGFGTFYKYKSNSQIKNWKQAVTRYFLQKEKEYWQAYQPHPNRAAFLFSHEQKCQLLMQANLDDANERQAFFTHLENDVKFLEKVFTSHPPISQEFIDYFKSKLDHSIFTEGLVKTCPKTVGILFKQKLFVPWAINHNKLALALYYQPYTQYLDNQIIEQLTPILSQGLSSNRFNTWWKKLGQKAKHFVTYIKTNLFDDKKINDPFLNIIADDKLRGKIYFSTQQEYDKIADLIAKKQITPSFAKSLTHDKHLWPKVKASYENRYPVTPLEKAHPYFFAKINKISIVDLFLNHKNQQIPADSYDSYLKQDPSLTLELLKKANLNQLKELAAQSVTIRKTIITKGYLSKLYEGLNEIDVFQDPFATWVLNPGHLPELSPVEREGALLFICSRIPMQQKHVLANHYPEFSSIIYKTNHILQPWLLTKDDESVPLQLIDGEPISSYVKTLFQKFGKRDINRALFSAVVYLANQIDQADGINQLYLKERLYQLLKYNPSIIFGRNIKSRINDYLNDFLVHSQYLQAAHVIDKNQQNEVETFIQSPALQRLFDLSSEQLHLILRLPNLNPLCYKAIYNSKYASKLTLPPNDLAHINHASPYSNIIGIGRFLKSNRNRPYIKHELLAHIILKQNPSPELLSALLPQYTFASMAEIMRIEFKKQINELLEQDTVLRKLVVERFSINDYEHVEEYPNLLPFLFTKEKIDQLVRDDNNHEVLIKILAALTHQQHDLNYQEKLLQLIDKVSNLPDGPKTIVHIITNNGSEIFDAITPEQCENILLKPAVMFQLLLIQNENKKAKEFIQHHLQDLYQIIKNCPDPLKTKFNQLFLDNPNLCELFTGEEIKKLGGIIKMIEDTPNHEAIQKIVFSFLIKNPNLIPVLLATPLSPAGIAFLDQALEHPEFKAIISPTVMILLMKNNDAIDPLISKFDNHFLQQVFESDNSESNDFAKHPLVLNVMMQDTTEQSKEWRKHLAGSPDWLKKLFHASYYYFSVLCNDHPSFLVNFLSIEECGTDFINQYALLINDTLFQLPYDELNTFDEKIISKLLTTNNKELLTTLFLTDPFPQKIKVGKYILHAQAQTIANDIANSIKIESIEDIFEIIAKSKHKDDAISKLSSYAQRHLLHQAFHYIQQANQTVFHNVLSKVEKTTPLIRDTVYDILRQALPTPAVATQSQSSAQSTASHGAPKWVLYKPSWDDQQAAQDLVSQNNTYQNWLKENYSFVKRAKNFVKNIISDKSLAGQIKTHTDKLDELNERITAYNRDEQYFSANIDLARSIIIRAKIKNLYMLKIKLDHTLIHDYIKKGKPIPDDMKPSLSQSDIHSYDKLKKQPPLTSTLDQLIDKKTLSLSIIRNLLTHSQLEQYKDDIDNYIDPKKPIGSDFRAFLTHTAFGNNNNTSKTLLTTKDQLKNQQLAKNSNKCLDDLAEATIATYNQSLKSAKGHVAPQEKYATLLIDNMESLSKLAEIKKTEGLFLIAIELYKKIISNKDEDIKNIIETGNLDKSTLNKLNTVYLDAHLKLLELYVRTSTDPKQNDHPAILASLDIILSANLPEKYFGSLSDCLYHHTIYNELTKILEEDSISIKTKNIKNLSVSIKIKNIKYLLETFSNSKLPLCKERLNGLRFAVLQNEIKLAQSIDDGQLSNLGKQDQQKHYDYATNLIKKIYQDDPDFFYKRLANNQDTYLPANVILATDNLQLITFFLREPKLSSEWVRGDEKDRFALSKAADQSRYHSVAQSLCLYQHLFIGEENKTQKLMKRLGFENTYSQKIIEEGASSPQSIAPAALQTPPSPPPSPSSIPAPAAAAPPPPPPVFFLPAASLPQPSPSMAPATPPPPPPPPPVSGSSSSKKHVPARATNQPATPPSNKPSAPIGSSQSNLVNELENRVKNGPQKGVGFRLSKSQPSPKSSAPKFSEFVENNEEKFLKEALDISRAEKSTGSNPTKYRLIETFVKRIFDELIVVNDLKFSSVPNENLDNFIKEAYTQFKAEQKGDELKALKQIETKKIVDGKETTPQESIMLSNLVKKFQSYRLKMKNGKAENTKPDHATTPSTPISTPVPKKPVSISNDRNTLFDEIRRGRKLKPEGLQIEGLSREDLKFIESLLHDKVRDIKAVQAILTAYMTDQTIASNNALKNGFQNEIEKRRQAIDDKTDSDSHDVDENSNDWIDDPDTHALAKKLEIKTSHTPLKNIPHQLNASLEPLKKYLRPMSDTEIDDLNAMLDKEAKKKNLHFHCRL